MNDWLAEIIISFNLGMLYNWRCTRLRVRELRSGNGILQQKGQSGWALILEMVTSEQRLGGCVGGDLWMSAEMRLGNWGQPVQSLRQGCA